jgi:hypothetical protein
MCCYCHLVVRVADPKEEHAFKREYLSQLMNVHAELMSARSIHEWTDASVASEYRRACMKLRAWSNNQSDQALPPQDSIHGCVCPDSA